MKAKKILSLALAAVFAFAVTAGADDYNRTDPTKVSCDDCPKCEIGNIPCPDIEYVDVQGEPKPVEGSGTTYPFDFDGKPAVAGSFGSSGYCTGDNYADDPTRNCKFIFDLCTCDLACQLIPGEKMGIQMYIKTAGVYFADPTTTVNFDIYPTVDSLCTTDANRYPVTTLMNTSPYYIGAISGKRISGDFSIDNEEFVVGGTSTETGTAVRDFGTIKYYRTFTEVAYNSKNQFESSVSNEGTPLAGALTTNVPAANRVVALQSEYETDYVITKDDAIGRCQLWIDIPAMRVDPSVAAGTVIEVQVRLLFNREIDYLCPECNPPDVCDCTLTVGIVCCDAINENVGCMYFPYMVQGIELTSGWVSGIAITSRVDEMPASPYCILTMTDSAGNVATYTKSGVNNIWTFMVEDIMPNFTGASLIAGPVSLKVQSNYSMDGYSFLADGSGGMVGTLARGCNAKECAP